MVKNLNFMFKNGEDIVTSGTFDYELIDNYIVFNYNNEKIYFKSSQSGFCFKRENPDSIFEIQLLDKNEFSSIYLKNQDMKFDILVNFLEYNITDNMITIKYCLESDEDIIKTIIIEL